jgi:diacylglycerol kinase family enzyme
MRPSWRTGLEAADPPRTPVLFVNPRSGGGAAARARVAERAQEQGIEVVELGGDQDLGGLVDQALAGGADALGMAGGDGSLAVVAAAASAHELPFICVPAGTRNHFARDLGLDPGDPAGALRAFGDGVEDRIDLGEVNGRSFLNLVSLGVYGEAVGRSGYRDAKVRTLLETAHAVLGPSGAVPELNLVDDLGARHAHPVIVLVSNNPYALERPLARGARPKLDGGRLGIIVIDAPPRHRRPPGRAWNARSLEVDAPSTVRAGVDGEAIELVPPLRFSIRPRALRVRVPRLDSAWRRPRRSARARRR